MALYEVRAPPFYRGNWQGDIYIIYTYHHISSHILYSELCLERSKSAISFVLVVVSDYIVIFDSSESSQNRNFRFRFEVIQQGISGLPW